MFINLTYTLDLETLQLYNIYIVVTYNSSTIDGIDRWQRHIVVPFLYLSSNYTLAHYFDCDEGEIWVIWSCWESYLISYQVKVVTICKIISK